VKARSRVERGGEETPVMHRDDEDKDEDDERGAEAVEEEKEPELHPRELRFESRSE